MTGGIAAKLMPQGDVTPFVAAFLAKREHAPLVANMPVRLVIDENIGLLGALAVADGAR